MSDFWKDKTIIVTGGNGFLGKHLVKKLKEKNPQNIIIPPHSKFDLTTPIDIHKLYSHIGNNVIVIHLAAVVGGIGFNQVEPAKLFYDNILMGTQLMHLAWKYEFSKFVQIGTTCSYPKYSPTPFKEEDLWDGYPEETNAPYGIAKKALLTMGQAYRQQYGFNSIHLIPVNLYGPGDNFKPESSHVIPALIKKFVDARNNNLESVVVWGDGTSTREFLYVEDCAKAILLATEKYNSGEPVNLGSGDEISIKNLVNKIVDFTGYEGNIIWDIEKPNGQPRRCMDTSKAFKEFGFISLTPFDVGLLKTINYYEGLLENK